MEWFCLILEEEGVKARLVTLVFGALLAFAIVLLNQFFIQKKKKER